MVPMPKNLNSASKEIIKAFLNSFDTILSDCDGVLWLERQVIEDSEKTINKFIEINKNLLYVTNNNSLTRDEYVDKLKSLGFTAKRDNVICTSYLASEFFKSINFTKKIYLIGNQGIVKELDNAGLRHTDIGPDMVDPNLATYIKTKLSLDSEVGAVLIGFDEHFSYPKILKAASYLKNPDCHFVATCSDETFPASEKKQIVFPGTGCFVRCLEAVSGRKATILGKPSDFIRDTVLKSSEINPTRTLMIGDRCNTDILFGNKCGFQTLLVMSGVTKISDVERYASSSNPDDHAFVPQYYINKLGDLLPYL